MPRRGYCAIGLWQPSKPENIGSLLRNAAAFDADFVFTVGGIEYHGAPTDTGRSDRHLPLMQFPDWDALRRAWPRHAKLVCLEDYQTATLMGLNPVWLPDFSHPEQALYLLGSEKYGLPEELLREADHVVSIRTRFALNVAATAAVLLYDRTGKYRPGPPREAKNVVPLPEETPEQSGQAQEES